MLSPHLAASRRISPRLAVSRRVSLRLAASRRVWSWDTGREVSVGDGTKAREHQRTREMLEGGGGGGEGAAVLPLLPWSEGGRKWRDGGGSGARREMPHQGLWLATAGTKDRRAATNSWHIREGWYIRRRGKGGGRGWPPQAQFTSPRTRHVSYRTC